MGRKTSDSLCLEDIPEGDHPAFLRALRSNLFSVDPDGGFVPPHRQLSEFLAARFLARPHRFRSPGEPGSRAHDRGKTAWL